MNTEILQNKSIKANLNIRLSQKSRALMDNISAEANAIFNGENKVKNDTILSYALSLLIDSKFEKVRASQVKELRKISRNVEDDWRVWEEIFLEKSKIKSKKGFKAFIMSADWPEFMKRHRIDFEATVESEI
jgi:hypothetical protein